MTKISKNYLIISFFGIILLIANNIVLNKDLFKKYNISGIINYQFQLVINNKTSDVGGKNINTWTFGSAWIWFYLDLTINNVVYDNTNFKKENLNNSNFHDGYSFNNTNFNYHDVFWTTPNSKVTLYTLNINKIKSINNLNINFTFGIFASIFHYQNTQANNYQYNFRKTYSNTKTNGTKLVINANGDWGN